MLIKQRRSFSIILGLLLCIQRTPLPAMGRFLGTITSIAAPVIQDLKKDFIPGSFKKNLCLCYNAPSRALRCIALAKLAKPFGLLYLPTMLGIPHILRGARIARVDRYHNNEYGDMVAMARQSGINPATLYIDEQLSSSIEYDTVGSAGTFTRNIIQINKADQDNNDYSEFDPPHFTADENRFMFGRELSHIAQKHMRSHIMTNIVTPWVVRACLIASNTIISTMLHAIVQRSEITRSIKLSSIVANIGPAMQFLLRNPIMESIYINRICTYASRRREKQADIEAARRFNCAQSGISLFQKIDAFNHRAYDIFDRLYYRIINGQPTPAQRIAYLRPIAEAQRAQAPGPEV